MTKNVYAIEQLAAALLAMTHDRPADALNILERVVVDLRRDMPIALRKKPRVSVFDVLTAVNDVRQLTQHDPGWKVDKLLLDLQERLLDDYGSVAQTTELDEAP